MSSPTFAQDLYYSKQLGQNARWPIDMDPLNTSCLVSESPFFSESPLAGRVRVLDPFRRRSEPYGGGTGRIPFIWCAFDFVHPHGSTWLKFNKGPPQKSLVDINRAPPKFTLSAKPVPDQRCTSQDMFGLFSNPKGNSFFIKV